MNGAVLSNSALGDATENPTRGQAIHRAYQLWEHAGKPEGRDQESYNRAERQLEGDEELKETSDGI